MIDAAETSMTQLVVLALDADVAGHLAVAIHRHRAELKRLGAVEPAGLIELETAAESVNKRQQASPAVTVNTACHSELDARTYLTRKDIHQLTGASISTVDRWIANGKLPSSRHGRIRRINRNDLNRFLQATLSRTA